MVKYLVGLLLLFSSVAHAAILVVSPAGSGSTCSVSSPCALQTGLDNANAGDTVRLNSGTYPDRYDIDQTAGTAGNRIRLTSLTCHGAQLRGDNNTVSADVALNVDVGGWDIDCLDIRDYFISITVLGVSGQPVIIRDNLLENTGEQHIDIGNTNGTEVRDNVIAHSRDVDGADLAGIWCDNGCDDSIFEGNVIYGLNNDGVSTGFEQDGHAIFILNNADDNLVQGNVFMDTSKSCLRIFNDGFATATGNVIRDNICVYAPKSSGLTVSDASCGGGTLIENNIVFEGADGLSAKGCDVGIVTFNHNTTIMNDFSRRGFHITTNGGVAAPGSIVTSNLTYSTEPNSGNHEIYQSFAHNQLAEADFNLWWMNGGTDSDWIQSSCQTSPCASYGANDIHNIASEPVFVNLAVGDITLQAGSPGKNAGKDSADMGATFNVALRSDWMSNLTALETVNEATSGTSHSIAGLDTDSQYQVFVFFPDPTHSSTETFTVEGQTVQRDYNHWANGSDNGIDRTTGNVRWHWIGTHTVDGTLNVSWTISNSVERVFARRMPTVEEAFLWIDPPLCTTP